MSRTLTQAVRSRRAPAARTLALGVLAALVLAGCSGDSPEKALANGKQHLARGDLAAAVIEFKNTLQKQPENGEARFLLGKSLLEQGDPSVAEAELRRAIAAKFPEDQALPQVVRAMLDANQARKLIGEFGERSLGSPEATAELKSLVGLAHLQIGAPDAAARAFAAGRAAKADHVPSLLGEARVAAIRGNIGEAERMVAALAAKYPDDVDVYSLQGEIAMSLRKFDAAAQSFAKVVEKRPRAGGSWFSLIISLAEQQKLPEAKQRLAEFAKNNPRDVRTSYLQAFMLLREGERVKAREAIQQVLRVTTEHVPTLTLAGLIELENGNLVQAEDHLRRALERVPGHIAAAQTLTSVYLRGGQPAKALSTIEPLLRARISDPTVLGLAGEVMLANNRVAEARRYFEQSASTADGKNLGAQLRLGEIYLAAGEDERALRALESARSLDPKSDRPDFAVIAAALQKREFDKALAAIDRLEKRDPSKPLPHDLRGRALLGKGDRAKARASFERALALDAAYFPAALNLASLDLRDGRRDDARKRFERVLEKDPKSVRASTALADVMLIQGRPSAEVVAVLQRATKEAPTSVEAHVALIAYHLRAREARQAVTAAQAGVASLPDSAQITDLLGVAQQAAGEHQQAIATYNKLSKQLPNAAQPLMRLASSLAATKDFGGAVKSLRRAQELDPANLDVSRELASVYLQQGASEQALREARSVQDKQPKNPAGHVLEGDVYAAQKQWANADRSYANGLKLVAAPGLMMRRLAVLDAAGKAGEVDALAQSWYREQPKDLVVRTFMAERAMRKKDYRAAAGLYQAALAQQPENPVLLNNLAWSAGKIGDPRALEYAERAVQLQPEAAAVLDTLGVLLLDRGQTERSLEVLTKAVQFGPMMAEVRVSYARALAKAGKKSDARREVEAALKLPDAERVKEDAESFLKSL